MSRSSTLIKVARIIRHYWFYIFISILCALASVGLTLYLPILVGKAVDMIVGVELVQFEPLFDVLVLMMIVLALNGVTQWMMNLFNNKITYNVVKDIRIVAFNKIENLPLAYLDKQSSGEILSRLIADVDTFSDGLLMGFTQFFSGVITVLVTLYFMVTLDLQIALVVMVLTPISLFVAALIAKKTYRLFQEQNRTRGQLSAYIDEMVMNQKIVQAFSHEKQTIEQFDQINQKYSKASLLATFYSSTINPTTRVLNAIVYAIVAVLGAFSVINGKMSIGNLTTFLSYANQYTKPFNEISGVVTELQNALSCADRVFAFIDELPQPSDLDKLVLEQVQGKIDFQHVYFSYKKNKPLIEDFNLHVQAGQRIAIVGPTGCGKSTLINLLMRFYDVNNGSILIDSTPFMEYTRSSVRNNFGMVLQDTWLKGGTIRDNITFGRRDVSDEEMIQAAKNAHAHGFIKRLPHGYDTILTESGSNLSSGQKQLLCIARVMLNLPDMLILDEATSNIDTRTEIRIQKAFAAMMEGRTSFIVAHRLSTIQSADLILVMREGKIIERGTHEELLKLNGFYADLYNSQFAI